MEKHEEAIMDDRASDPTPNASAAELWTRPPEWVDVDTARIALRRTGQGPPLLLLHGWPLSSFSFRKIIPHPERHFTCYLPDTPGLGETEWTEETDFLFAGQARSFSRMLDRLGIDACCVLAFELTDARRIERLVLLNTEIPHHRPPFIQLFQTTMKLPASSAVFRLLLRSQVFCRSAMGFGGCFADLELLVHEEKPAEVVRAVLDFLG
jgi:hypothetical protein